MEVLAAMLSGCKSSFGLRDVLWELSIIHMLEEKKKRQANEINTTDNAINSFASFMNAKSKQRRYDKCTMHADLH